jgi:pimeloyl-ACP methyl ester carboxylesterase
MNDSILQEKSIETKNGKIYYYKDLSFPNKPVVVFLHGLSANHTTWLNAIQALHNQQCNSLALDLRGHGFSDKTKKKSLYQLPVFVEDVRQIIKTENLNRFFLVGYSYGGSIAAAYVLKYPQNLSGLMLISANLSNPLKQYHLEFFTPLAQGLLNFLSYILLWQKRKAYYYYEPNKSKGYWHSVWIGLNTMPISVNFWMLAQTATLDLMGQFWKIQAPTQIVRAKKDPFLSNKEIMEISKIRPQTKIITPAHASHFLLSKPRTEITQIILDFIQTNAHSDF